eukprot:745898-Hanusia_phi.AAC.6
MRRLTGPEGMNLQAQREQDQGGDELMRARVERETFRAAMAMEGREVVRAREEISRLKKALEELQIAVGMESRKRKQAEEQTEIEMKQKELAQDRLKEMMSEIVRLKDALNAKELEIVNTTKSMLDAQQDKDYTNRELQALRYIFEASKKTMGEKDRQLEESIAKIQQLAEEKSRLQDEQAALQVTLARMAPRAQVVIVLQVRLDCSRRIADEQDEKFLQAERTQRQMQEMEQRTSETFAALTRANVRVDVLEEELRDAEARIAELQRDLEAREEIIQQFTSAPIMSPRTPMLVDGVREDSRNREEEEEEMAREMSKMREEMQSLTSENKEIKDYKQILETK